MWSILVLTTLCTAGILDTISGFDCSPYSLSTCAFPGVQVVLVQVIALGVGCTTFCLAMPTEVLHLDLVLLASPRLTYLSNPGSIFTLMDRQFLLIITTTGLLFLDGILLSAYGLATADVANTDRTEVSEWLIAIVVLMNLCVAGIAPGFSSSLHGLSPSFPGMQVVLVLIAFVGSKAFCLVMPSEVLLHLDLGLLSSLHQVD